MKNKQFYFLVLLLSITLHVNCQNVIKEGVCKIYDASNKQIIAIEMYQNNLPDGIWTTYRKGGDSVNLFYKKGVIQKERYWNRNGALVYEIAYQYNNDTLVSYTKWGDTLPPVLISKEYVLNGTPVGYFVNYYENNVKKSEGTYSMDTNKLMRDRKDFFMFLDDLYINGISTLEDEFGFSVSTENLLNEYYENGDIKVKIIPSQTRKLKGQVLYYNEDGVLRKINSIEYGLLTKDEIKCIIDSSFKVQIISDLKQQTYTEERSYWYLNGNCYTFNEVGLLEKMYIYKKGKLVSN